MPATRQGCSPTPGVTRRRAYRRTSAEATGLSCDEARASTNPSLAVAGCASGGVLSSAYGSSPDAADDAPLFAAACDPPLEPGKERERAPDAPRAAPAGGPSPSRARSSLRKAQKPNSASSAIPIARSALFMPPPPRRNRVCSDLPLYLADVASTFPGGPDEAPLRVRRLEQGRKVRVCRGRPRARRDGGAARDRDRLWRRCGGARGAVRGRGPRRGRRGGRHSAAGAVDL